MRPFDFPDVPFASPYAVVSADRPRESSDQTYRSVQTAVFSGGRRITFASVGPYQPGTHLLFPQALDPPAVLVDGVRVDFVDFVVP